MAQQTELEKLSQSLRPLCPRDGRAMHFEAKGLAWQEGGRERVTPCYSCEFEGCSVRYTPLDGYFTAIMMPDFPQAVEEPGINLLQCPRHNSWLYRTVAENAGDGLIWRCGVEACDCIHADCGPAWPSL
jgi:hypothetical protein